MKTIAFLFGGETPEYPVSLSSAYTILTHLPKNITPIMIGIDQSGDWYLYKGELTAIKEDQWKTEGKIQKVTISTNKSDRGLLVFEKDGVHKITLDGAFILIHGQNGEDGSIQGLLKLAGIPLIGSSILGSSLSMDKYIAHKVVESQGILCARSVIADKDSNLIELSKDLTYPLFIKPVNAGSSFGISKIYHPEKLESAREKALQYDDEIIIEEMIEGVEVGVAVFEDGQLYVGEVDEVENSHDFFDFEEKYQSDTAKIYLPARFDEAMRKRIQECACQIFKALKCRHFARVDLFITKDNHIYFNEVNTIPGLTDHSRYPRMLESIGISIEEMIKRLVDQL